MARLENRDTSQQGGGKSTPGATMVEDDNATIVFDNVTHRSFHLQSALVLCFDEEYC